MADNYSINYEDERFRNVENEKQDRLNEINATYDNMINQSNDYFQRQIDATKDYATTQQELQNQQTDLAVNEINQAKEKAQKDYLKEQRGAYSDWQKQSDQYGAVAEQRAASGLGYSGYSESSQVSMYNQYQNRVSAARDSYNLAIQNYDNKIAEARLANNSKLAEIAYNALQNELELSLNGFQYKNNLLLDQINKQQSINDTYYNRWRNVLDQINTENALAESIRQYNENMAYKRERDRIEDEQWQKQYELSKKASSSSRRSSSGGGGTSYEIYDGALVETPTNATTNTTGGTKTATRETKDGKTSTGSISSSNKKSTSVVANVIKTIGNTIKPLEKVLSVMKLK